MPSDAEFAALGLVLAAAIYDESVDQPLFVGEVFGGPGSRTYDVPAVPAGRDRFRCDVHPEMAGSVIAQQLGLGFVTAVDPTQGQQGVLIGNFLSILGMTLLFATDTHHLVIAALMTGERPVIYGDGEQSRDFTYVGNVVEGNVLAMAAEGSAAGW